MPASQCSFKTEGPEIRFHPEYTGIGLGDIKPVIEAIQINLTRDVERVLEVLQTEVSPAVNQSLPGTCEDWTSVVMYESVINIIAMMFSSLYVGQPLARNEEWLNVLRNYLIDAIFAEDQLWKLPQWSLPITARLTPISRKTMGYRRSIRRLIAPLLKERLRQMKKSGFTKPHDILQSLIDYEGIDRKDLTYYTDAFATFALASIQNTGQAIIHMIYDLAAYPEHVPQLREELQTVLLEDGGRFQKSTMPKLRKLDSFMKESQRVNPPGLSKLENTEF